MDTTQQNSSSLAVIDTPPVPTEVLVRQVQAIQSAMKSVMVEGTHYGKIPGCGEKPTLLKPGAEKIALMFRLTPYLIDDKQIELPDGHREHRVTVGLRTANGLNVGFGVGSATTRESKWRYRKAERSCPTCHAEAIITSKSFETKQPDGFLCWPKRGGCGAKFKLDDTRITSQAVGRAENPDIADALNTVLKMAKKRAFVDAVLTATAASDIFTQDVEDFAPPPTPPTQPTQVTNDNIGFVPDAEEK